ncbi:hypothetical protein [Streptomyces sp. NPDC050546]|uniref:hypothetical protein n=1 Tax=Streptomyces sp. NPDC050546 TaxID=3365628 RepID=UPI0037908EFF
MTPEGWEWLKGQPRAWEAPSALHSPTASAHLNLGVQMIGSNIIGNDLVELVAKYMAAHARLELWMGDHEPPLTMRQQFERGRVSSEALRLAYEAWVEYEAAHRAAGGKVTQLREHRKALKAAVHEATEALTCLTSDEAV